MTVNGDKAICYICKRELPISNFRKDKRMKKPDNGYSPMCIECFRKRHNIQREASREKTNLKRLQRRHELGQSVLYGKGHRKKKCDHLTVKMKKNIHRKVYRERMKKGGELKTSVVQLVYEDNIKRYGTLTCYLCLEPIEFGQDSLDHNTPLSRGGTNEYSNLYIACRSCNSKKHNRTESEYRQYCITKGVNSSNTI